MRSHEKEIRMSSCKGCGQEIIFGKNYKNGKMVPLQVCKHVYRELGGDSALVDDSLIVDHIKDEVIYVSHYLFCSRAELFSGLNKPVVVPPPGGTSPSEGSIDQV